MGEKAYNLDYVVRAEKQGASNNLVGGELTLYFDDKALVGDNLVRLKGDAADKVWKWIEKHTEFTA